MLPEFFLIPKHHFRRAAEHREIGKDTANLNGVPDVTLVMLEKYIGEDQKTSSPSGMVIPSVPHTDTFYP